ncbi:DNA-directed RNA polymerase III subunit RPC4 isoform X2 [Aethina tumida]|uniref:DNA-directed RNA polymerase III subunit RPC4 isoform X2 n=1 Tax=Aethina tumida TaxID=116153 RepID=UPI00096B04C5|nr:DNA-directed RNA polymerase III subunit RPC4 isoform X2 [Aethina tumida]
MEEKLLKNLIKNEKPGGNRLKSIRMPRDLNLGGTKPKKVYTPNLNVVRNKDKNKEFIKKNEPKQRGRASLDKSKTNTRQSQYVQSSGVFADGMGADTVRFRDRRSNIRDNEERSSMAVPTIKKDQKWEVNKVNEDRVIDDIMGNDNEDSDDEKLSLKPVTWCEQDFKLPPAPKLTIKSEEPTITRFSKYDSFDPLTEFREDCYSDDNPNLSIWNLPESFAGKGFSDDPKVTKVLDYPLSMMLEGQIGKLVIRKSGKMQVQIGNVMYDLESADSNPTKEDIVSISDNGGKLNASVLGPIQNRFILNPNWEMLLKQS